MNAENEPVAIARPHQSAPTVILVDGLTRSGKSLLGPILASYSRVEIERLEPDVEWIADMHHLGKVETDAAVALLRLCVHRCFYEGMICRNTNFRFSDHSSIWQQPNRLRYFRRMFMDERLPFENRVTQEKPIYQTMVHHQMMNLRLFHEAFGNSLRMVEMIRDPIDLADSWIRKKKGELIGDDPLITMIFADVRGTKIPWYVAGRHEEYLAASPIDRVLMMIASKWHSSVQALAGFNAHERSRVFVMPLEHFVTHPEPYLAALEGFLGTTRTRHTPGALKAQRCPRTYDVASNREARQRILGAASRKAAGEFQQVIDEHASLVEEIIAR